jgi:hypothetical protein
MANKICEPFPPTGNAICWHMTGFVPIPDIVDATIMVAVTPECCMIRMFQIHRGPDGQLRIAKTEDVSFNHGEVLAKAFSGIGLHETSANSTE